jgi:hypothetical protein
MLSWSRGGGRGLQIEVVNVWGEYDTTVMSRVWHGDILGYQGVGGYGVDGLTQGELYVLIHIICEFLHRQT